MTGGFPDRPRRPWYRCEGNGGPLETAAPTLRSERAMEDGRSVRTVDLATDSLNGRTGNPAPPYLKDEGPAYFDNEGGPSLVRSDQRASAVRSSTLPTSTLTPGPIVEEITSCLM